MQSQKRFADKVRIRTLGIAVLGCIILFAGMALWVLTQDTPPPDPYFWALGAIAMLCVFVSSFFVIKYKEMPRTGGLPSVTGPVAVVGGVLGLSISGFAFAYSVYELVIWILS